MLSFLEVIDDKLLAVLEKRELARAAFKYHDFDGFGVDRGAFGQKLAVKFSEFVLVQNV